MPHNTAVTEVSETINKKEENLDNTLNGVDTGAVKELVQNVEADPELGLCKFHITNNWITCGKNQSKVESFYAAKQENFHDATFLLNADEPPLLAGHGTAPNPVEHLLNALASCLTTTIIYHAAVRGIKIEKLESVIEGDLDIRGFLELSKDTRCGYKTITVNFKVKTDAENIDTLKTVSKLSPVFDVVSNGTHVAVNFERIED